MPRPLLSLLALLALSGCPTTDPGTPTPTPAPDECANLDFSATFAFTMDICWYGTLYANPDLEDLAMDMAQAGEPGWALGLPGRVVSLEQSGGSGELLVNVDGPDLTVVPDTGACTPEDAAELAWIQVSFQLPLGLELPAAIGEDLYTVLALRFVDEENLLKMARGLQLWSIVGQELGPLRFYAEPGAWGQAFDERFVDSGIFSQVQQKSYGCPPVTTAPCGELVNTSVEFRPLGGSVFELWPGESHAFTTLGNTYQATNIWSYDWQNVSCSSEGFVASMAYLVLGTAPGG